jgi:hypothetical protein
MVALEVYQPLSDSRAPQTPFAARQDVARKRWEQEFLAGLAGALGYVPASDATTPDVSVPATPPRTMSPLLLIAAIFGAFALLVRK